MHWTTLVSVWNGPGSIFATGGDDFSGRSTRRRGRAVLPIGSAASSTPPTPGRWRRPLASWTRPTRSCFARPRSSEPRAAKAGGLSGTGSVWSSAASPRGSVACPGSAGPTSAHRARGGRSPRSPASLGTPAGGSTPAGRWCRCRTSDPSIRGIGSTTSSSASASARWVPSSVWSRSSSHRRACRPRPAGVAPPRGRRPQDHPTAHLSPWSMCPERRQEHSGAQLVTRRRRGFMTRTDPDSVRTTGTSAWRGLRRGGRRCTKRPTPDPRGNLLEGTAGNLPGTMVAPHRRPHRSERWRPTATGRMATTGT